MSERIANQARKVITTAKVRRFGTEFQRDIRILDDMLNEEYPVKIPEPEPQPQPQEASDE